MGHTNNLAVKNAWSTAISESQHKFAEFNILDFQQEQIFATQSLMNNDYLMELALANPTSLKLAMYNVAAIGLTLNPSQGLAYLIPRKGTITVDISYRGLINLGVDCGAIAWAKAELVYEKDKFFYKGPAAIPEHDCDPFGTERGEVIGGYCIASLTSGGVMVEPMSRQDMEKIKAASEAFKKGYGPWIEWESQMQLKSIVKRAFKWWPKSTPRMANAIKVLNEDNGEGLYSLADNSVTELPPPPRPESVPENILLEVNKYINRAVAAGAYEACGELIRERITQPLYQSFALSELQKAKETNAPAELPKVANQ